MKINIVSNCENYNCRIITDELINNNSIIIYNNCNLSLFNCRIAKLELNKENLKLIKLLYNINYD